MQVYWEFGKRSFQRAMTYRAATLAGLALSFFFSGQLVPLALWPDWLRLVAEWLSFQGLADVPFSIFDGPLEEIRRRFDSQRVLVVDYAETYEDVAIPGADLVERGGRRATYRLARDAAPTAVAEVLRRFRVEDLAIRETEIEEVVKKMYRGW